MSHHCAEAKLHGGGRGLLGFAQLMTRDEQPGVKVTTSYRQDFPFIGRPLRTVTRSPSNHVLGGDVHHLEDAWLPVELAGCGAGFREGDG